MPRALLEQVGGAKFNLFHLRDADCGLTAHEQGGYDGENEGLKYGRVSSEVLIFVCRTQGMQSSKTLILDKAKVLKKDIKHHECGADVSKL